MFTTYYRVFLLLIISNTLIFSSLAQYKSFPFGQKIRTLQVKVSGDNPFSLPIIDLGGNQQIELSFDELSHDIHNYYYTVEHCNADWTPSMLSPLEWADGFTTDLPITDVLQSTNTTMNYTHYRLSLPNDELSFKISGNYAISIYKDSEPEKKIAVGCFSIVDSKISIDAQVRGNTDIDIRGKMQQIDFYLHTGSYAIDNPSTELKITVQQNGRFDNMVKNLSPTYISGSKLSYINNKALIFEGGNEYHTLDISSIYAYGERVNKVRFYDPYYHAELFPNSIDPYKTYTYHKEVNGKFVINIQEYNQDDTWADYLLVHFALPAENPIFDGQIYLLGGLNYNQLNETVRMEYNTQNKTYEKTVLLKQGGYNYLYGFVPKGSTKALLQPIESSHWETENEYTIYVYHRGFGDRYDKLIAVKVLQSGE